MLRLLACSTFAGGLALLAFACSTFGADVSGVSTVDAGTLDAGTLDSSTPNAPPPDASILDAATPPCPAAAFCDDFDDPDAVTWHAKWKFRTLDGNGAMIEHSGAVIDGAFHSVYGPLVDAAQAHALLVEPFNATKLDVAFDVKVRAWDTSSTGEAVLAQIVTSLNGPLVSFAITGNGKAHLDVSDGTQAYAANAVVDFPFSVYVRVELSVAFGAGGAIHLKFDGTEVSAANFMAARAGFTLPVDALLQLGGQHFMNTIPGFDALYDRVVVIQN
jgi:hypothetical protein